ncbi:glycosyltransferase family 1 protein [Patulibacter sp. SYSU D01012]|uniref:glycosyltransferase family 4 protein n=1 Tax=Patulibacter sp. SYSU D01012 TaxID=2817381 RepID=UPI001B315E7E
MPELRHVGLNLLYLVPGEVGGSEIYAHELVDALGRARPDVRFTAYAGREAAPSLRAQGWPANVRVHEVPVTARNKPARVAAEVTLLPGAAARAGVDLLHSLGTTSPPVVGRPSVVTILDLIYEAYPGTFPPAALMGLRALVGPAARRATRVITISEAVKRDVVARLRVPAERVRPVLLGSGVRPADAATPEAELRERLALGDGRLALCVSAALVHKNLPRLLEAFARLDPGHDDVRLVVAGHHGREHDALVAEVARLGLTGRVVLTGWIADEDLEGLYAAADVCVYPSLYEGFGMPVLEAMVRGVPLACSNATSLPEVAGDAALLFDPHDPASIAAAMTRLLDDPAEADRLRAAGRAQAATFTWERCAAGVLDVYDEALRAAHAR